MANEITESNKYVEKLSELFPRVVDMAKPLLKGATISKQRITEMLSISPAFIELVESVIPKESFQAIISAGDQMKIAEGALKLMTKKNGEMMATLVDTTTNKIVSSIPIEKVNMAPNIAQAITNYSMQMQMIQISEQLVQIQITTDEIKKGQENDRLAEAYSCQQKYLQACTMSEGRLKEQALLMVIHAAEDSRNLLMLSQKENLEYIKNQPQEFWKKVFSTSSVKQTDSRISDIQTNLLALNMVSFIEAASYQELGEKEAAKLSLNYYSSYIQQNYLDDPEFLERMDGIDQRKEKYWSCSLPDISDKIHALPSFTEGVK